MLEALRLIVSFSKCCRIYLCIGLTLTFFTKKTLTVGMNVTNEF